MSSAIGPAFHGLSTDPTPIERSLPPESEALHRALRRSRCEEQFELTFDVARLVVLGGLREASRRAGVCERTVRRQFEREGTSPSAFVTAIRLSVVRELLERRLPTRRIAFALGFGSSASFRRFLHQHLRTDLRTQRRSVTRTGGGPASVTDS